jgi:hypothetical protein
VPAPSSNSIVRLKLRGLSPLLALHAAKPSVVVVNLSDNKNTKVLLYIKLGETYHQTKLYKNALKKAEKIIVKLAKILHPSKYHQDVWLSGYHLRFTEILITDSPSQAKKHLKIAKQIIDSNPELKLRRHQWQNLLTL